MFSSDQIAKIRRLLSEGVAPEKIADAEFGVSLTTLRSKLANSGYRILVKRELEQIVAVAPAKNATPEAERLINV